MLRFLNCERQLSFYERFTHVYKSGPSYLAMFTTAVRSKYIPRSACNASQRACKQRHFASEDLTLPCCYATVASSWQKVAQRPRKHAFARSFMQQGPGKQVVYSPLQCQPGQQTVYSTLPYQPGKQVVYENSLF